MTKSITTVNAAIVASRTKGGSWKVALQEGVEIVFSAPFTNGVSFYSCRIFGTVFHGFLNPEDEFSINQVRPRTWYPAGSYGNGWFHTNWCESTDLEGTHQRDLVRLLDRKSNFCPGRLRKYLPK